MTQRQLANATGVSEQIVSRDEKNEYHAITIDRAQRILDALGYRAVTIVRPADTGIQEAEALPPMLGVVGNGVSGS